MTEELDVRIRKLTELETFALWFHQDWMLDYDSLDDAKADYLKRTPKEQLQILKPEIEDFLNAQRFNSPTATLKAWNKLGAVTWDPKSTSSHG